MDPIIAIRLVHYGAAMLLFGGGIFQQMLAPNALRAHLAWLRTEPWLALLALVSAVLWFAAETADIGSGWRDAVSLPALESVATETPFGTVWLWRLALALVLVVLCLSRNRLGQWLRLLFAALLLVTLALVGHAAMDAGAVGVLHHGNDMLHLLAAGFWLGSLPPLALSLRLAGDPQLRGPAIVALRRFSILGIFAVAAILLTGVANALLIFNHGRLAASPYWILLGAKIVLVLAMVGLALINRVRLMRRLRIDGEAALATLRRNTLIEIALGAGVVALVSVFGTLDPG
jgi:copper resistance protein D